VDEEEKQVEGDGEHGGERRSAQLHRMAAGDRQQRTERAGDEQVAVADHGRAQLGALQARQARSRVRGVQRTVRALQQIGDHERGVGDGHRDDAAGEPARRRDER
jgi:hypothetical protein